MPRFHSAGSRNRIRNCPQIDADTEKNNSSSAFICVICGQRPFLVPTFIAFCGKKSLQNYLMPTDCSAKSHQPAGRASGPLRNFRPHNNPQKSA
jgi:hypothetical protein